ncbi:MAG: DUF465 domain-containing protein [Pseudomonadota bacterium]
MSHTPHELAADFPEFADDLHRLKLENAHLARLMDEYHEVNRAVHRAETLTEPMSRDAEAELRRRRVSLKDEIYGVLKSETT